MVSRGRQLRNLVIILGDQLDRHGSALDGFNRECDVVWMAEVASEACHVPQHQQRLVLFFSAMRHFRDRLRREGIEVVYQALSPDARGERGETFADVLAADLPRLEPRRVVVTEPGDWRVRRELEGAVEALGITLEVRPDTHFYLEIDDFRRWVEGRNSLVLEHFYRYMRRRFNVLMDGDRPEGGAWNYDRDNRRSFGRDGPGDLPRLPRFAPDDTTREVIDTVSRRFAESPGDAAAFDAPVTADQARESLARFVAERLCGFGDWQDALWSGTRFLYHSRLSAALNLHLLDPRDAVDAAVAAYRDGLAPLNAVEGFVRQILGWREFVRGVYWLHMPGYAERNALGHEHELPGFFWDGRTDMACVADAMSNVLDHGYAHHIQRLMVLGLFAQLYGVHPYRFHEWHMGMYLDAVDWVSLPNTLGMSQFGDGGVVGTKPYCASGAYIHRMSNHCQRCRYDPAAASGERACPFTAFYWEFLARHRERFSGNRRLVFQMRNLERRRQQGKLDAVLERASGLRDRILRGDRI